MEKKTVDIVIVEDSPMQATLLRRILKREGHNVIAAQDGDEGLELIYKHHPGIVITDIDMPGMNGYELCRQVKDAEELSNIPVVLVTSLLKAEDLIHGIEVGADNYITKPYSADTLVKKVDELIAKPLPPIHNRKPEEVVIDGEQYKIRTSREHILNFLITTYENISKQNQKLTQLHEEVKEANKQLEVSQKETQKLLYNILPKKVADGLMAYGKVRPERYDDVTIMFSDFNNFSAATEDMNPQKLVKTLEAYFDYFDDITERYGLEKIKTIGDSYMFAGGLPERGKTHPVDMVLAALEIREYMENKKEELGEDDEAYWPVRLGINTGQVIAGIIGEKRIAYDVWGNTVNLASRMESYGTTETINVSENTYNRVKDFFECESRGKVTVKGFGPVSMYFVNRLKEEYSKDDKGYKPNKAFQEVYEELKSQPVDEE